MLLRCLPDPVTKKNQSKQTAVTTHVPQIMLIPMMLGAALLWYAASLLPVVSDVMARRDRFVLDQYHRSGVKTPLRDDIVVLGIDDDSRKLDSLWPEDLEASSALSAMKKRYPFPRRVWAEVLDRLIGAGAKLVFLDLTFASPDPDPEDDRILREALERHKGRVVIGAKFEHKTAGEGSYVDLMRPNPGVSDQPKYSYGLLNFWPDSDEVVRTANFRVTHTEAERLGGVIGVPNPDDKKYQSVAAQMASISHPESLNGLPDWANLRFSPPGSYPSASLMSIFVNDLWQSNYAEGEFFKDKIVMVGAVAADLQDFQDTPIGRTAGVQIHAQALAALLTRSFVNEAPEWWSMAATGLALLLAWLIVSLLRQPLLSLATIVGATVLSFHVGAWFFDHRNLEISPLPFGVPLVLCGLTGLAGDFIVQLREKRKLQRFLARYTSPEIMEEMLRDREGLYTTLNGVGRNVTVLFSDVRSFTSMSEGMTPREIVTQLNEYLSIMVEKVFLQRGLVDKFIGDAVMALWGSTRPLQTEAQFKADAINAVTSALNMRAALKELNVGWVARGMPELQFGIGIHQGPVVVGNIGSDAPFEKMDFTVIGDTVNTASRLEGTTKQYGVDLIVSSEIQQHICDEFVCRTADLVAVKGKNKPVEICAVEGKRTDGERPGVEDYERGVQLYRAGSFTEALHSFNSAAEAGLADSLTLMYQERCQNLIATPPAQWTGVYVMTSK